MRDGIIKSSKLQKVLEQQRDVKGGVVDNDNKFVDNNLADQVKVTPEICSGIFTG